MLKLLTIATSGGAGSTSRREQREAEKAARQEEAQKQERTADRKKSPNDLAREKEMKADLDKEANANRSYLGPVKEKPQPTYTKEDVADFQAIADRQNRAKANRAGGLMNPSMRAEMDAREAERQKSNQEFGKGKEEGDDNLDALGRILKSTAIGAGIGGIRGWSTGGPWGATAGGIIGGSVGTLKGTIQEYPAIRDWKERATKRVVHELTDGRAERMKQTRLKYRDLDQYYQTK